MKSVVIKDVNNIVCEERPLPNVPKDFVLVKVKACAICATDLEIISGQIPAKYPLIPGHEWSGVVVDVGEGVDKAWINKRVTGSNDVVCLKCEACRSGDWRYCKDFEEIGFKRDGAYAEYIAVPSYGLVELPNDLPFEYACLAEPVGVAIGTMEKAQVKYGQTCLIFGAGSIGLCCLAVAKSMGLKDIVVVATSENRLKIAKALGATGVVATNTQSLFEEIKKYHPNGTDVIIEATGIEECIQNSLKLCRKGGTVALAGYGRGKVMNIRIDDIHINNLKVVGAGNNWNMHKKAIEMIQRQDVNVDLFVSEKIKLENFQKGIEMAASRPVGFVKAVFTFE